MVGERVVKASNFSTQSDKKSFLSYHRFGVNYVPSRNWYYCYNDWRPEDIQADLDAITELGADHIRLMVVWPWFQPNPASVSSRHLDYLEQILNYGAERGLDVLVTLFTGWLSGFHFSPPYLENEPFYTSPRWAEVQDLLLNEVAGRTKQHVNFLGFDLGNEINCNWRASQTEGDAWMRRMLGRMQALFPDRVHVNGVDHLPWFADDTFSPAELISQQPIVPLHCWPFWSHAGDYGQPMDAPYTLLAAGMAALARTLGKHPQKPIWVEEFGVCNEEMPEF